MGRFALHWAPAGPGTGLWEHHKSLCHKESLALGHKRRTLSVFIPCKRNCTFVLLGRSCVHNQFSTDKYILKKYKTTGHWCRCHVAVFWASVNNRNQKPRPGQTATINTRAALKAIEVPKYPVFVPSIWSHAVVPSSFFLFSANWGKWGRIPFSVFREACTYLVRTVCTYSQALRAFWLGLQGH